MNKQELNHMIIKTLRKPNNVETKTDILLKNQVDSSVKKMKDLCIGMYVNVHGGMTTNAMQHHI
jgi:hypothetical protein